MKKIEIEDITKYKFLSDVRIAPDKRKAAFVVKSADIKKNAYKSNIFIHKNGGIEELTQSDRDDIPRWSLDSKHLYFVSERNKIEESKEPEEKYTTDIFVIEPEGGEARLAFRIPYKVKDMKFLGGSSLLLKCRADIEKPPLYEMRENERRKYFKLLKEEEDYEILDEIPFWQNGEGFTNKSRDHLFLYNLRSRSLRDMIPGNFDVDGFDTIGDKTVALLNDFKGKKSVKSDVYVIDVEGDVEKISSKPRIYSYPFFLSDKDVIVLASDGEKYGVNENGDFFSIDISSKEERKITENLDKSVRNSILTDCELGSHRNAVASLPYLYFITTEGASSYLNKIDLKGNIERVIDTPGSIDSFDVVDDELIYVAMRGQKLQEIYASKNGREVELTKMNENFIKGRFVAKPEHYLVDSGGIGLDAWIMKPINFDESKEYPAIFEIHGGPKCIYSDTFFHEMQVLCSKGYAVFYCNPRGSDGKGNEFMDIFGKYGGMDYRDLMTVVDHTLEKYRFIDKNRVGVTGGSYGGYITNWIIGHTSRFRAAVSQRSIANWISKFGTTDIGYYFVPDQIKATPWENPKKLWHHSPMKYANKCTTPTLFIHSQEDYRCWLPEGVQMFTSLKYHGVDSKLCMFKGENHDLSREGRPKHRMRRLQEIIKWFDGYL